MRKLGRHARVLVARSLNVLSVLLLLGAFLLLALRLVMHSVPDYEDEVEAWLSNALGQPVTIGAMRSTWRGWRSVMVLSDVRLLDAQGQAQQRFEEMQVAADLRQLLLYGRIAIGRIRLSGAHLLAERRADRSIVLAGLGELSLSGDYTLPDWLLGVGEIELKGSELLWLDRASDTPQVRLSDLDGSLRTDGMHHLVHLSAQLPRTQGERVEIGARLSGAWQSPEKWSGEVYVKGDQLQSQGWFDRWLDGRVRLQHGTLSAELWGHWSDGGLQAVDGTVVLDGAQLRPDSTGDGPDESPLLVEALSSVLRWIRLPDGWVLELPELRLVAPSGQWPVSRVRVTRLAAERSGDALTRVAVSYLRVDDAVQALRRFRPQAAEWAGTLLSMAPTGALRDLRMDIPGRLGAPRYEFQLDGLSTSAAGKVPGVTNLTAGVSGEGSRGMVRLDTGPADVLAPGVLEELVTVQRLQGTLEYGPTESGFQLVAREILIGDEHIDGRLRMSLQIPAREGQSPFLDLQIAFQGPPMGRVTHYLPMGAYGPVLRNWLHSAFADGRVRRGDLLFYGQLSKFPFADGEGLFEARLETEAASVNYHAGWPALHDVQAVVVFRNTSMHVDARSGSVLEGRLRDVTAHISRLGRSRLQVQGDVQGDAGGLFRYLAESPLRERYGKLLEDLRLSGPSALSIMVDLPLGGEKDPLVQGQVTFRDAQLELLPQGLRFESLNGTLGFSDTGLDGPDLPARVLGEDVSLSIITAPQGDDGDGPPTWVRLRGRIDPVTLARNFPLPVWDMLEGTTEAELSLKVPARAVTERVPMELHVRSDLAGLAVGLPQPLGKGAREIRPLDISAKLDGSVLDDINASYGEALRAHVSTSPRGRGESASVHLHFGPGTLPVRDSPGLHLTGELQELDLSVWLDLASRSGESRAPVLSTVAVDIGELKLAGQGIHEAEIRLQRDSASLAGSVRSREMEGTIRLPLAIGESDRPIELNLSRLALANLESGGQSVAVPDPAQIPPLQITADELTVAGINLGALLLVTSRTERGQRLETLRLKSADFRAEGRGTWEVQDGAPRSDYRVDVYSEALSRLLNRLGIASIVEDGETNISAGAGWQGGPQDFSLTGIGGDLRFDIGRGRFLDLEPGVGRVFGLMNLQTVLRRLTLDFSDFFAKGYTFDSIKGDFSLSEGDAYAKRLIMESPSSSIEVAGRTGLVDRDYDQQVTVIPKVSTSLPIAGVLAAGPAVGGVLLLAQQLIGNRLDRITRIRYEITGPWSEPVITRLGALGDSVEGTDPEGSVVAGGVFGEDAADQGP